MNILFVDMHNKFRSKVGEAIMKKLAGDRIGVKSCGLVLDMMRPFVCQNVHVSLNMRGYRVDNEQPRQLYRQDIDWADAIIIISKGFPVEIFERAKEKVELWSIEGADETEKEKIDKIVEEIEKHVRDLAKKVRRSPNA